MTTTPRTEACPGPYRVSPSAIDTGDHVISAGIVIIARCHDEPTARLLAASWSLREASIAVLRAVEKGTEAECDQAFSLLRVALAKADGK